MINRIKGNFEEKDGDKYLIISTENGDTISRSFSYTERNH